MVYNAVLLYWIPIRCLLSLQIPRISARNITNTSCSDIKWVSSDGFGNLVAAVESGTHLTSHVSRSFDGTEIKGRSYRRLRTFIINLIAFIRLTSDDVLEAVHGLEGASTYWRDAPLIFNIIIIRFDLLRVSLNITPS